MKKRKIVRQFLIDAVIDDTDLSTKVAQALSNDTIEVSPDRYYDIEIVFDRHVYRNADFYRFPLSKDVLQSKSHAPNTKEEKAQQRINDILSEQLDHIMEALEHLEVNFMSITLIGDNCASDSIRITIYCHEEAEKQEGKTNTPIYKMIKIIPALPALLAYYVKSISDRYWNHMSEETMNEDIYE